MPVYKTQSYITSLMPGDIFTSWSAEQPVAGNGGVSAGERIAVQPGRGGQAANYSVDGFFSAAPGAFEIDMEPGVRDTEASYSLGSNKITAVDANNNFHTDITTFTDGFLRPCMVSRGNAVNVTLTIKRTS